jgi:hypothetical protein
MTPPLRSQVSDHPRPGTNANGYLNALATLIKGFVLMHLQSGLAGLMNMQ